MNITHVDLEQLILTRMFGAQCITRYDPGAQTWLLRVPTVSGVWRSDVEKLRALPGCEVTEGADTGGAVELRVRFALAARIEWG